MLFGQPRAKDLRLCSDSAGYKSQLERHPATIRIVVKKLASIKAYHQPMAELSRKLSCFELS